MTPVTTEPRIQRWLIAVAAAILIDAAMANGQNGPDPPPPGKHSGRPLWRTVARLNVPREYPGLFLLADGRVLAEGGHPAKSHAVGTTAECYDPKANRWTMTRPLNTAHHGGAAVALPDGRVVLAGGWADGQSIRAVEVYDPKTDGWTQAGQLHTAGNVEPATLLADGRILIAGGIDWDSNAVLAAAEIYDAATGRSEKTAPMPTPRMGHSAVRLASGDVLARIIHRGPCFTTSL